ncbi:uncharacterized protein LOC129939748 [Eupeodes corollae]|uniref:uncharacterized protein LOC129939748 n=1 Tax=Eupeodes corollae TaxID=290404 RepID=UPI00249380DB|nr:uncharacterized protein LOC129939748 [Eupeodes corollae]
MGDTIDQNNNPEELVNSIQVDLNQNHVENIKFEESGAVGGADVNTNKQQELLDMVFSLESEKQSIIEESRRRITQLRKDLEESLMENEKQKKKISQLEQTLVQSAALGGIEGPKSKQDQEELLLRAKTLLFEKTKVCKQQEQQIATLKTHVDSMKDVVAVTKDMLNLKTAEADHTQSRLDTAMLRIKAERDKCAIFEKKLAISQAVYEKLRSEYDVQSNIFKGLKEAYEQKVVVLSNALERAKQD